MRTTALLLLFCIACNCINAQSDTEVYLFDITTSKGKLYLTNQKNISNQEGYDNQPFFLGKNALLFSGTIDGNTEIVKYVRGEKKRVNVKTSGGEYSPQSIPGDRGISAVRLDPDGRQRLYRYEPRSNVTKEIVSDAIIAYYTWVDKNTLVSASIVSEQLHLVIHDLLKNTNEDLEIAVGRSFHKIPNSNLVSFIDTSKEEWFIKSLDPKTKDISTITALPKGVEDIAWLPNGSLLITYEASILIKYKKSKGWELLHTFENENLKSLSRIAVSPDGSQLAVVSEVSPGTIVQKHIDPFNKKELDAFLNAFSDEVVVNKFIADTLYKGKNLMRTHYQKVFENQTPMTVTVSNRIITKNIVIDEERVTSGDQEYNQVTIYQVAGGKISSMTFVAPSKTLKDATAITDAQLHAYNNKDIEGFMELYSKEATFIDYPSDIAFSNLDAVKNRYRKMFKEIPDLKATIKNRITIGDLVIDHEEITIGKNSQDGVVINKVNNGKITQVIFL